MTFKQRIQSVTTKGWVAYGIWSAVYIAFIIWVACGDPRQGHGDWASLGWLALLPVIMDMFTT